MIFCRIILNIILKPMNMKNTLIDCEQYILKSYLKTTSKILFFLLLAYLVLMVLTMLIPNSLVTSNVTSGVKFINAEGLYPEVLRTISQPSSMLDNFTDRLMLEKTIKISSNPLISAMSVSHYERYWHGYLIFLRPLLAIFQYATIRYLNMFGTLLIFSLAFHQIASKINKKIAVIYAISTVNISFFSIFLSLQFSSVFYVLNIAIIILLHVPAQSHKYVYYFFLIGSLVNFFDLLTYPLITLGIPLVTVILYTNMYQVHSPNQNLVTVLWLSTNWAIGYAVTWVSKWCLATLILRKNIIKNALNQVIFRAGANSSAEPINIDNPKISHSLMYKDNFDLLFNNIFLKLLLFALIIWILSTIFMPPTIEKIKQFYPILIVSLFPYIWFYVLSNHSQVHFWMTYRIQAITVFAVLAYFVNIITPSKRFHKLRHFLKTKKNEIHNK